MKFWVAMFAALLAGVAPTLAHALDDPDTKEIAAYQLTEAAFVKYSQATRALGSLAKQLPADCGDDDAPQSLTTVAAKLDASPQIKSAIQAAGMTTREYLVFSFALVQAGVGVFSLEQPGAKLPPGMSIANVNFAKVHKEAIDALGAVAKSQCDEDDSRN